MSQPPQQIRFVDRPTPRAKPIPRAKWDEHKEELCSLYQRMTLDDLMVHMKIRHRFEPSSRQLIYQFEKWGAKKYNTVSRDMPPARTESSRTQAGLSRSAPDPISHLPRPQQASTAPKRPKSMGSLQSHGSRSSMDRPVVPPKKKAKLADYMASRDPFANPVRPRPSASVDRPAATLNQLANAGLQFASTGQPSSSFSSPLAQLGSSSRKNASSAIGVGSNYASDSPTMIEEDGDWMTVHEHSDSELLLPNAAEDTEMRGLEKAPSFTLSLRPASATRRQFDSSRPIHSFSQQELVDIRMAAQFLRSLGFDSDAFELFTIILKQLKEPGPEPPWKKNAALVSVVRTAFYSPQIKIARTELFKLLDEPRDDSSDAEHFLYRMLLTETYTRSNEEEYKEWLSEIAIGCELANDRMLDRLPAEHRSYDIVTYHYLNKCLEYLNSFVKDDWDQGTIFTDKEHLQIRMLERIPGPFELRHGSMRNPCLRSCLEWCIGELQSVFTLPDAWTHLSRNDCHYVYWTDHIGLYCAMWQRWQCQRRDFSSTLATWMSDAESRMGILPAELLSIVCGMIMDAAPPRLQPTANIIMRARSGARAVSRQTDVELGRKFLDTYSLLGTLLSTAPQRQFHDEVSLIVSLFNSTRQREAFSERARLFARSFIEDDMNMRLPEVQRDPEGISRQNSNRLSGFVLSDSMRASMENLAATLFPALGSSVHSSELSHMRSLRDHIQAAARSSFDRAVLPPSAVARLTSCSQASLTTIGDLSNAMSGISLSSTQEAVNGAFDTMAADIVELFSSLNDPFRDHFGEVFDDW